MFLKKKQKNFEFVVMTVASSLSVRQRKLPHKPQFHRQKKRFAAIKVYVKIKYFLNPIQNVWLVILVQNFWTFNGKQYIMFAKMKCFKWRTFVRDEKMNVWNMKLAESSLHVNFTKKFVASKSYEFRIIRSLKFVLKGNCHFCWMRYLFLFEKKIRL